MASTHFGDVKDRESDEKLTSNLEAAGHAIEMLALLEEKTKGNLTDDESRFIKKVLYELRLRYVEAKKSNES